MQEARQVAVVLADQQVAQVEHVAAGRRRRGAEVGDGVDRPRACRAAVRQRPGEHVARTVGRRGRATSEYVVARATVRDVGAGAAVERVGAAAAVQVVVAATAVERVGAGTAVIR